MKYQWKSIGNPLKIHFEIQLEIQMGILNSKEITNEIKLSFQLILIDISMKHQWKSIGNQVEISLIYQWKFQ